MTLPDFLGRMASLKAEYNSLLPASKTVAEVFAQRNKCFMVCTLAALGLELAPIHDQILPSPNVPTMDEVYSRLLWVSPIPAVPISSISDNSVMAS